MSILKVIKERRSIREYAEKEVEKEKIRKVLEAGRWAPSGNNQQPWRYIVVTKNETRKKLMKAAHNQSFIREAPVVIVVCNEKGSNLVNIGLTLQNICLEAYALGLGSCIVGWFKKERVEELLAIPREYEAAYLVPIGYPAEEPTKSRKKLEELVHYETW